MSTTVTIEEMKALLAKRLLEHAHESARNAKAHEKNPEYFRGFEVGIYCALEEVNKFKSFP